MLNASKIRKFLRDNGYSDASISAAWPYWWSDDANSSASSVAELRFTLARNLGIDPRSFFSEEDTPRFVWTDEARFKHLKSESNHAKAIVTSFGISVAGILAAASPSPKSIVGVSARELRAYVLRSQPFVRLLDLLGICWAVSHPVIHLRVFPMGAKRMAAMTVRAGEHAVILLARDDQYPAWIAFYLAHELGHIVLGHLSQDQAIVDLERIDDPGAEPDAEEIAADRFALELLTGNPEPTFLAESQNYSPRQLAASAQASSLQLGIEPGTIALCFGHATGDWRHANAALRYIYQSPKPVWEEVNGIAERELAMHKLTEEPCSFLRAVMGLSRHDERSC